MSEEEARIALLQEYDSNARNWYNVLLGLAIVFFTIVQVRAELRTFGLPYDGFQVTLWAASLAFIFSQTGYVLIRAVVHIRLAEIVVDLAKSNDASDKNYLKILLDKTEEKIKEKPWWKIGWLLGTPIGWFCWTIPTVLSALVVLVFLRV